MDRDQASSRSLLDVENKLIAEILAGFRNIIRTGTERVDNTASTGQAAFNSMAMGIHTQGLVKSVEELHELTRKLRELWVAGALKMPGEGDDEAQTTIKADASAYFETLNAMRRAERMRIAGAYGDGDGTVIGS